MADDTRLLRADAQARLDALDVSRSFVVQAPAGSGKTELLIQRYLKLLSGVQNPEEILAITFTRKAALEMQSRVSAALMDAKQGVTAGQPHHQLTLDLATVALRRGERLDWRLTESPRRMRIQTLDSFCAGLAKSLPVSSGLGGLLTTASDAEMQSLYRRAAAGTLDWLSADDHPSLAVTELLVHLDNHTGAYVEHLARMLETRDQWLGLTGSGLQQNSLATGIVRRRLEANIRSFVSAQLDRLQLAFDAGLKAELLPLLQYVADTAASNDEAAQPVVIARPIDAFPGSSIADLPTWRAIASLLLKQDGDWRKSVNKNDGFPPKDAGEKKRMQELLATLPGNDELRTRLQRVSLLPDARYSEAQWSVLLALFGLLPLAVVELRRLFSERGITDHTEVALAANVALGNADDPGDIALSLDYSIQHILIDEMQDTSIGQYQLIEKLLGGWVPGDGKTLFCVGDPMQSVYRFRDAEVGRFLKIRQEGIAAIAPESLVLRRNFRSGAHLVHWFNTVFAQVFPLQDDIADGAICYSESVPVDNWQGQGSWQVHALFGAGPEEEARYGQEVIRRCQADAKNGSSALLVRSRTQLPALLRNLRDAGIEYKAVEIDRLTDLPEIVDVLALTRAMCHDADRLAWLALLRGPWVGLNWSELHWLVLNDTSSTVRELLADSERLAGLSQDAQERIARFSRYLKTYFGGSTTEALRDRVEVAWYGLGGPALLKNREQTENVYRYFDVLEKIESAGTLVDVTELDHRLDDERVSSIVDDSSALQVMTMHKAKGLEFDNVILYALGRSTRGRTKSVLSWTNVPSASNSFDVILSPIGPRAELENDRLHQCIEAAETAKERLELDRLLYVACTRARRTLHLIGSVSVTADGQSFRAPPDSSLLGRLWPAVKHEYAEAFSAGTNVSETNGVSGVTFEVPPFRRFRVPFGLPEPPEIPGRQGRSQGLASKADIEFYWVGMAARQAGTIVHRWLKRFSQRGADIEPAMIASLRPATLRMATELGVPEAVLEVVCDRVEKSLLGVLNDPRGQWLVTGDGFSELPLSGRWEDSIVSVVIDRVRINEGVHWVVDYKTSSHEGGDLQRFLDQEGERYRQQLLKYVTLYRRLVEVPVRAGLYFPLLQEFREVAID